MASGFSVTGDGQWVEAGRQFVGSVVVGAVLDNATRLVLTLALGAHQYHVELASDGGEHFAGTWSLDTGLTGAAGGALYRSLDGFFFFGRWAEGEKEHLWWFHLHPGEAFADD